MDGVSGLALGHRGSAVASRKTMRVTTVQWGRQAGAASCGSEYPDTVDSLSCSAPNTKSKSRPLALEYVLLTWCRGRGRREGKRVEAMQSFSDCSAAETIKSITALDAFLMLSLDKLGRHDGPALRGP